ncbi:hypothetical protein D3C73_789060 [compost metagenome]
MAVSAIAHGITASGSQPDPAEHLAIFLRQRVAYRIGQVNNRRTFLNDGLHHFNQIIDARPCGIHGGELHHLAELAGIRRHLPGGGYNLGPAHAQLMAQVNIRGGDEQMKPPPLRIPGRPHRSINIPSDCTGKAADFHALHLPGDRLHGGKIPGAGYRKPRLQHIHTQFGQFISQNDLLFRSKTGPGSLLAVTQRRIENLNSFLYRNNHGKPS